MIKKKVSLLRAGEAKFSVAMSMTLQYVFSRAFVDALYAVVGVRDAYRHQTARGGLCVPSTAQTLHRPTMISRHTPKIIQLLGSHRKVRASKVSGRYAGRIGRGCHKWHCNHLRLAMECFSGDFRGVSTPRGRQVHSRRFGTLGRGAIRCG